MADVVRQSSAGRPVSRLVSPVLLRLSTLVGLMAAICVVGVVFSIQAVSYLSDSVQPATTAQVQVTRDMADLDSAVTAYLRIRVAARLQAYESLRADVASHQADLQRETQDDINLATLVTNEISAENAWITRYADPLVHGPGGPLSPDAFARGLTLRQDFMDARDATESLLDQRSQDAGSAAVLRFRLTIVAALLLLGFSWIMIGRSRSRLLAELSEPLTGLEKVVQRMLRNDPEGRADQDKGPKEVRAIARALNDFADAQSRARAVEGRIQDELHVLDSAKDDFVSNVSHELRTPLTTISGYLEMVADEFEGRLEPRHERMLEATRRNVVRLRTLIDDLLALSKVETRPTELEPSDVTEMITDAVTDVRMTAARRGITLDVTAPDEPMRVVSDRAMLYRAFLNVLTNAVKFSHDDATVEVLVRRVQNRVEVAVSDHGIGIPRAELDRLGTRFFRASNAMTNEIAGTGLGLRIVQTIIDKHAGDVIIESTEGEGTTVFIRLRLHGERVGRAPAVAGVARLDDEAAPPLSSVVGGLVDENLRGA